MVMPYEEDSLILRKPSELVIPEPPRCGEPGGDPCGICNGKGTPPVWEDNHWTMRPAAQGSLPGTVWLATKGHYDSFPDLPDDVAASFGGVVARAERAIKGLGDIARVHLYRWGDANAHFAFWLLPRPLGMLDARAGMLPLWEAVMDKIPNEDMRAYAEKVAANM